MSSPILVLFYLFSPAKLCVCQAGQNVAFLAFSSFIIPIIGTILGNPKIEKNPEPIKIQIKEAERAINV